MEYRPREFWDQRLSQQFDLRGTGETGLSLAYNRACYELRREVLGRALAARGFDPRGRRVLDVGCGTGFFTAYYLDRGAVVTGLDIAPTSIARLGERFPGTRFVLADVSETRPDGSYDLVNAFDVLYHIVDDTRWERAVAHLCEVVAPGGWLVLTDSFPRRERPAHEAAHNRMRSLARYQPVLRAHDLVPIRTYPTHVLLNRHLGPFRSLNRLPGLLHAADRVLLALGFGHDDAVSKLLVAKKRG
ncbi:MAG TPA: class I SAM-dependent methyltransferase [Dongiaceae bacterium]|nr:class I SAM-dependent methyltransferase [Dongiaceae bacterium]